MSKQTMMWDRSLKVLLSLYEHARIHKPVITLQIQAEVLSTQANTVAKRSWVFVCELGCTLACYGCSEQVAPLGEAPGGVSWSW